MGTAHLVNNTLGSVAYAATAPFAPNWAYNNLGGYAQGLANTVTGTAQLGYNVSATATYGVISPFAPDVAYNNYGGNVQQLMNQTPSFYGGNDQSQSYQIGYGTVTAASMLLGGEAGEAGNLGKVGDASSTADVVAARQSVAQQFYQNAGWSDERIANHLQGIDFNQPVDIVTVPQGSQVVQYQIPGNSAGNYFAPVGTSANGLGIYTSGRVGTIFTATQDTTVLRSTAASVNNTWEVPGWNIQAPGGNTQLFSPNPGAFAPNH